MVEHPFTILKVPGSNPGVSLFNVILHAIFFLFVYDFSLKTWLFILFSKFFKILKNDKKEKQRRSPIQNFQPKTAKNLLT